MRKLLIAFFLFALCLVVLSPLVQWLDSPGLTLSGALLDIAHPPGQPLYALTGHLGQFLPFGTWPLRLCLLNIVLALAGAYFFTNSKVVPVRWRPLLFLLSGVMLFTYSHWVQIVRQELYLLQLCLFSIGWYLAADIVFGEERDVRQLWLLGLLTGLAATNHHLLTIFVLFPMVAGAAFFQRPKLREVLPAFLLFLVGLSVFSYLPLRAAASPPLNFGNPVNFSALLWVVGGELYGSYSQPTLSLLIDNLVSSVAIQMRLLTPLGWLALLVGWGLLYRAQRKTFWFILVIALCSLAVVLPNSQYYAGNPDLHGYLLAHLWLFFLGGAIGWFISCAAWLSRVAPAALYGGAALVVIVQFAVNYKHVLPYMEPESDRFVFDVTLPVEAGALVQTGSYKTHTQLLAASQLDGWREDLSFSYRGLADVSKQPRYQGAAAPGQALYVELAIDHQQGEYKVRKDSEQLSSLIPQRWFFLQGGEQTESRQRLSRAHGEHLQWLDDFTSRSSHPALQQHLQLGRFLHQHHLQRVEGRLVD